MKVTQFVFFAALSLLATTASAAMYQCVDRGGVTTYSPTPCPGGKMVTPHESHDAQSSGRQPSAPQPQAAPAPQNQPPQGGAGAGEGGRKKNRAH